MRISVIIPTYRGGEKLLDCIQSVLDQTRPADEVLVVDSSDDDAPDRVRDRFGDRVTLLHQEERTLPGAARNIGVHAASGDVVAFTDDDCIADPHWLEEIEKPYQDPAVVWVTGGIWPYDNDHAVSRIDFWAYFSHWLMKAEGRSVAARAMFNLSFRRDQYLAHSDATEGMGLEDGVFNVRFERDHGRAAVAPDAMILHRNPLDLDRVLARHLRSGTVSYLTRSFDPSLLGGWLLKRPWLVPLAPWWREAMLWYRMFRFVPREGFRLLPHAWSVHRVVWAWYRGFRKALGEGGGFQWRRQEWRAGEDRPGADGEKPPRAQ